MKKIFSLFLVLIFLSGCIPSLEQGEELVKEGIHKIKAELQKDLGVDEYAMREGDSVTVDNKVVRLISYNADYVTVFDVDGQEREMRETQDPQIVNGIELTMKKRQFDASDMDNNHVVVKIVRYVSGENEYIFYLNDEKEILGHTVKLNKLEKDGTVTLSVDVANDLRIMVDRSDGVADIYVSNIRPNYRAIASERYVILKIVEKP